jgi:ribosomal protein S18 acetylase RimI-like enzyme
VAAHDELIAALYDGELESLDGARLATNRWVDEPEWNHAGALDLPADRLDRTLARIAERLAGKGRPAAVVVDPFSRPPESAALLLARGWSEVFRHSGLLLPAGHRVPKVEWPRGAEVEEIAVGVRTDGGPRSSPAMRAFTAVFRAAFEETAGGALSPGYEAAFAAALVQPRPEVAVVHTLVRIDGEPAAVGSRATIAGVAGLYNLGVAPPFRRLGLGGAVTLHRAAAARAAGADVVYLLTEDPQVEAAQLRRGFVKRFELLGLREP